MWEISIFTLINCGEKSFPHIQDSERREMARPHHIRIASHPQRSRYSQIQRPFHSDNE